jgi:hypothetical protein
MLELVSSNKCLSWEEMSFKFNIGLTRMRDDCLRGRNPRNRDNVLLKPTGAANKEFHKMGVARLGLLTYDWKST